MATIECEYSKDMFLIKLADMRRSIEDEFETIQKHITTRKLSLLGEIDVLEMEYRSVSDAVTASITDLMASKKEITKLMTYEYLVKQYEPMLKQIDDDINRISKGKNKFDTVSLKLKNEELLNEIEKFGQVSYDFKIEAKSSINSLPQPIYFSNEPPIYFSNEPNEAMYEIITNTEDSQAKNQDFSEIDKSDLNTSSGTLDYNQQSLKKQVLDKDQTDENSDLINNQETTLNHGSTPEADTLSYKSRKIPIKSFGDIRGGHYDLGLDCDENGNIYLPSFETNKIHVFTTEGVCINTIDAEKPAAVCVRNDKLYISEWEPHAVCLRKIDGSLLKKFGSYGGEFGQFKYPLGIATDLDFIYICDWNNHRLQVMTHYLNPVKTMQTEEMKYPSDICIHDNSLYVLNSHHYILIITIRGVLLKSISSIENHISGANFFCFDNHERILISDRIGGCIQVFTKDGELQCTIGREHNSKTDKSYCYRSQGIAVLSNGIIVNVCSFRSKNCIQFF